MIARDPFPPQAVPWMVRCMGALGLSAWTVTLAVADAPDGDAEAEGHTRLLTRYRTATITIRRDLAGAWTPDLARLILHELLHVATAVWDQAISRVVDLVPVRLQPHARLLLTDGEEYTIEALARSLYEVLPEDAA